MRKLHQRNIEKQLQENDPKIRLSGKNSNKLLVYINRKSTEHLSNNISTVEASHVVTTTKGGKK